MGTYIESSIIVFTDLFTEDLHRLQLSVEVLQRPDSVLYVVATQAFRDRTLQDRKTEGRAVRLRSCRGKELECEGQACGN